MAGPPRPDAASCLATSEQTVTQLALEDADGTLGKAGCRFTQKQPFFPPTELGSDPTFHFASALPNLALFNEYF